MASSTFFVLVGLLLLASSASACTCARTDFKTQFFAAEQRRTPLTVAKVLAKYTPAPKPPGGPIAPFGGTRTFLLEVQFVYTGCPRQTPYYTTATSALGGSFCGIDLRVGSRYLLPLRRVGDTRISSCGVAIDMAFIKKEDKQFLDRRELCCKGKCRCANSRKVFCKPPPCSVALPGPDCKDVKKCVNNFCGICDAEFFNSKGLPACVPDGFPKISV